MKLKPLRDRVLVKRVEEKEQRRKGIIVPDSAKEKPLEGTVVAVGTGRVDSEGKRHALEIKAGQRVLFGRFAGKEVRIDDVEHLILGEDEVLGIIH
jgi:chaperonin GroES